MTEVKDKNLNETNTEFITRTKEEVALIYSSFFDCMKKLIPEEDYNALHNLMSTSTYVAGGFFRSRFFFNKPNDIDFGFNSKEIRDAIFEIFDKYANFSFRKEGLVIIKVKSGNYKLIFNSNLNNLCPTYSFNCHWVKDLCHIVSTFDFNVNRSGYCIGSDDYYSELNSYRNYSTSVYEKDRSLFIKCYPEKEQEVLGYLCRMTRFASEGFIVEPETVVDMCRLYASFNQHKKTIPSTSDIMESLSCGSDGKTVNMKLSDKEFKFDRDEVQRIRDRLSEFKNENLNSKTKTKKLGTSAYGWSTSSNEFINYIRTQASTS